MKYCVELHTANSYWNVVICDYVTKKWITFSSHLDFKDAHAWREGFMKAQELMDSVPIENSKLEPKD